MVCILQGYREPLLPVAKEYTRSSSHSLNHTLLESEAVLNSVISARLRHGYIYEIAHAYCFNPLYHPAYKYNLNFYRISNEGIDRGLFRRINASCIMHHVPKFGFVTKQHKSRTLKMRNLRLADPAIELLCVMALR